MASNQIQLAPMNPEYHLLFACARTVTDRATDDQVKELLREPVDWHYLLRAAQQHAVIPLLQRNLSAISHDLIPTSIQQSMDDYVRRASQGTLFLTSVLIRLVTLLEQHNIPVIPYKGPALAAQIYGNLALRQSGDIDLLIRQCDLPRARELLLHEGLEASEPFSSNRELIAYAKQHHEYRLLHLSQQLCVELQWKVVPLPFPFPPHDHDWWLQLPTSTVGGKQMLSLPPETLLLILCAHGAKHLWSRLIWLCDIATLVQAHPELDLLHLAAQAKTLGIGRIFLFSLSMAHTLLGTQLPPEVLQQIRTDKAIARFQRLSMEMILLGGNRESDLPIEMVPSLPLLQLAMLDRLKDRFRACQIHYPHAFNPIRVIKTYGTSSFGHFLDVLKV